MKRQRPCVERQIAAAFVEADRTLAGQQQAALAPDFRQTRLDRIDIDLVWLLALQAEQHRLVRPVTAAGRTERAIQFGPHPCHAVELSIVGEPQYEHARRPHRPDRVR